MSKTYPFTAYLAGVVRLKNQSVLNSGLSENVNTSAESLKILIVDDHLINRQILQKILSHLGYSADVACNGLEALAALRQRPYHLIFMDIQMPEMDGITATQRIVQLYPDTERPVVIGITAHASRSVQEHCLQIGMDAFFLKPILKETIASILTTFTAKICAI